MIDTVRMESVYNGSVDRESSRMGRMGNRRAAMRSARSRVGSPSCSKLGLSSAGLVSGLEVVGRCEIGHNVRVVVEEVGRGQPERLVARRRSIVVVEVPLLGW
jgi:hypothetical protein